MMQLVSWVLRSSLSLSVLPPGPQPHPGNAMWCFFFQLTVSSLSLKISNSCLRLLLCLYAPPIFPSTTSFRRQFLGKTWPIELAFLLFFLSHTIGPTYLLQPFARSRFSTFKVLVIRLEVSDFQHHINTGRFKMFSVITNIYNKKTKGPTLM